MSGMSDYLEAALIGHIFRGSAFSMPTTLAIGLLTATASDTGGGTEVTGGDYARVTLNPSAANWSAPTGNDGTTKNNSLLTFPTPTADWGRITHWGLYDAASSGNLLFWGALTTPKNVNNGDPAPTIAIGACTVQLDN